VIRAEKPARITGSLIPHLPRITRLLARVSAAEHLTFMLIGEDKTTKQIARIMGCKVRTIEWHRLQLARKLNLRRHQLIIAAVHYVWRIAHQHQPPSQTYEI
jgi:DNA-binding CsgD family transcriptional regulator